MDVYVLTENGHVLGAGTDRSVCEDIADRRGEKWDEWHDAGAGVRERFNPRRITDSAGAMVQRITRVPLAGMVTAGELSAGLAASVKAEMATKPITYEVGSRFAWDQRGVDMLAEMQTVMQRIVSQKIRAADESIRRADRIRVGDGPAWEYMRSALDKLCTYPDDRPLPDSQAIASIMGLPVVMDPNIPGDEIRVGTVIYKIGTAGGMIREGQMVSIDLAGMDRAKREISEEWMADLKGAIKEGRIWY